VHPWHLTLDRDEAFPKQRLIESRSYPKADQTVEAIGKPGEHCAPSILCWHTADFTLVQYGCIFFRAVASTAFPTDI